MYAGDNSSVLSQITKILDILVLKMLAQILNSDSSNGFSVSTVKLSCELFSWLAFDDIDYRLMFRVLRPILEPLSVASDGWSSAQNKVCLRSDSDPNHFTCR